MKAKSIFAVSLLVAGAAFADTATIVTTYTLGVFPLEVGKEAIINIPWVESGNDGDDESIAVTNIIKTATLAAGDHLYYYNTTTGEYLGWDLSASGVWEPVTTVTTNGLVEIVSPADKKTLTRGGALVLDREASFSYAATTNIYIVGQVSDNAASVEISAGYNLIAPPIVSGSKDLTTLTWTGANIGDELVSSVLKKYTWNGSCWTRKVYDPSKRDYTDVIYDGSEEVKKIYLPAGNGIFYNHTGDGFTLNY